MSSRFHECRHAWRLAVLVAAASLAMGCEEVKRRPVRPGMVGVVEDDTSVKGTSKPTNTVKTEPAEPAAPAKTPREQAPPNREVADVTASDAKAGASLKGDPLAAPVRALFWGRHRIEFIKMEGAMRDFKVLNGRLPKSQEEFMEKIIEKNAVNLPELDGDWEYFYDVEAGELKKRKKA